LQLVFRGLLLLTYEIGQSELVAAKEHGVISCKGLLNGLEELVVPDLVSSSPRGSLALESVLDPLVNLRLPLEIRASKEGEGQVLAGVRLEEVLGDGNIALDYLGGGGPYAMGAEGGSCAAAGMRGGRRSKRGGRET
jgi:hypothetical protein